MPTNQQDLPDEPLTSLNRKIQLLVDVQQTALKRLDDAFTYFSERSNDLATVSATLTDATLNLNVILTTLIAVINDSDEQIDDLSAIGASMSVLRQKLEAVTVSNL